MGDHSHGHQGKGKVKEKKSKTIHPDPENTVSDEFRKTMIKAGPGGTPIVGIAMVGGPVEMEMILDFTGLRGSGSNIYYSLIFQLPKWGYAVKKVDEYIEVTPTWREYYDLTIGQKEKIEHTIKSGLTSASQAVADYELLKHDLRRYREVLDYFISASKYKDEHVLRSLFVDRVDAHTGEGYSMITMTKRWPTIITDFIRMKSDGMDRDRIRKELDVTDAEATVLLTKSKLYQEWKELFLPTVKDRVARLQVLVDSRKKSIEEYRLWLKPYMARFKMIREKTELKPKNFVSDPYMTPGFGQSQALTGVKLWFWRAYYPPQKTKMEAHLDEHHNKGFIINPYDKLVREWKEKIEERYHVSISDSEVDDILKGAVASKSMEKTALYYVFFECNVVMSLIRTPPPEGFESDNLMLWPIKTWVLSQNALLVHLIELYAREKAFERDINVLIGSTEAEEEALERIEEEFKVKEDEKITSMRRFIGRMSSVKKHITPFLERVFYIFVKRGPYEPVFVERVTKTYLRGTGGYYGQVTDFIMEKMGVE